MNAKERYQTPGKNWQTIGIAKRWYRVSREATASVQGVFKALETTKRLAVTNK